MRDPTRIVDDGDEASGLARDLLRAGRGETLSAHDRARVWADLSATLVAPAAPAAASAGATKTLASASLLKGAVVAVALSGGALVGVRAVRRSAPRAVRAVVTEPARGPEVEPPRPAEGPPPALERAPHARRAPSASADEAAPRLPASRLAAEAELVLAARRDLRDGNAASALRRLEVARPALVGGALAQEREALTIEALHRSGQPEAAARRARAFLRTYPRSPHAASVSTFAKP